MADKKDKYLVQTDSLTAIADAIREKTGESSELEFPTGFVNGISSISNNSSDIYIHNITSAEKINGYATIPLCDWIMVEANILDENDQIYKTVYFNYGSLKSEEYSYPTFCMFYYEDDGDIILFNFSNYDIFSEVLSFTYMKVKFPIKNNNYIFYTLTEGNGFDGSTYQFNNIDSVKIIGKLHIEN